jgi:hypothetical protein
LNSLSFANNTLVGKKQEKRVPEKAVPPLKSPRKLTNTNPVLKFF